jgi:hypothetical protein
MSKIMASTAIKKETKQWSKYPVEIYAVPNRRTAKKNPSSHLLGVAMVLGKG